MNCMHGVGCTRNIQGWLHSQHNCRQGVVVAWSSFVSRWIKHRQVMCHGDVVVLSRSWSWLQWFGVVAVWNRVCTWLVFVKCWCQLRASLICSARNAVANCLRGATTLWTPWARVVHFVNEMCIDGHVLHSSAAAADAAAEGWYRKSTNRRC